MHINMNHQPPNIVLIIMDDLCWGDLGCHGNPYTHTPNLDHLYEECTRLTRFCSGPLCSPARANLMTGRYHYRTHVVDTYIGRSMMDPSEVTLAEVLRNHGYHTGIFGKWHLGDCYPMRAMDKGFEEALVHNGGGIGQPGDYEGNSYFDPVLHHNGIPTKYSGYCTDIFTDAAISFIEKNQQAPFFVYLATNCPHTPLEIADEWVERYRMSGVNETHAKVYGMVENIDVNVGRILKKLDAAGLTQDTIVIFTSDHGPCPSAMHERKSRFNANLRGVKGQMYEGGIRVPCFWRWPGKIPAARDLNLISNPIDVLPTLVHACGSPVPSGLNIDGVNLLPVLTGQSEEAKLPERYIFMQWHRGDVPVRYRNLAVIGARYKLYRQQESAKDELYDIMADPMETVDVSEQFPEIVEQMRKLYDEWFTDVSATDGKCNFDPPLIWIGTPYENPTVLTRQDWRIHGPDGWDNHHFGHWEVDVKSQATYHFRLRMSAQSIPGIAYLKVNTDEYSLTVNPGVSECSFNGISLESGPAKMEAWLQVGDQKISVRYLDVISN